jgi:hypothetical protein
MPARGDAPALGSTAVELGRSPTYPIRSTIQFVTMAIIGFEAALTVPPAALVLTALPALLALALAIPYLRTIRPRSPTD